MCVYTYTYTTNTNNSIIISCVCLCDVYGLRFVCAVFVLLEAPDLASPKSCHDSLHILGGTYCSTNKTTSAFQNIS